MRFDETLIKRLVKKKIQNEIGMGRDVKLFDGSLDLLEHLQGKVKLGLASMNDREVIDYMLKMTNIQRFFDAPLTADDISEPKPNPEIFLKCALKLGTSPERCVVVEDSIFGVEAAKKARMGCIAVLTGVYSRRELENAGADLMVSSLREKEAILHFVLK
jgi:HAD superfamily hydrolase (TIGR01509 family)